MMQKGGFFKGQKKKIVVFNCYGKEIYICKGMKKNFNFEGCFKSFVVNCNCQNLYFRVGFVGYCLFIFIEDLFVF